MQITVTVRALVIHDGKLLMCQHPGAGFYCLPGGKLEPGETLEAGMARELKEETGITADIGRPIFINQFINATNHRVEVFFLVNNNADFAKFDRTRASHAHEVVDFVFGDPTEPRYDFKPSFIRDRFAEVLTRRNQFELEIIAST